MKIPGAHIVVTGGASGLGLGTCEMLLQKGCKLTILDRSVEPAKDRLLTELKHDPQLVRLVEVDLTDYAAVDKVVEDLKIIRNNAQIGEELPGCVKTAYQQRVLNVMITRGHVDALETREEIRRKAAVSAAQKAAGEESKNVSGKRGGGASSSSA